MMFMYVCNVLFYSILFVLLVCHVPCVLVVQRGLVELMEPTALRTRLLMFLHVSVTPREVHLIFKKFDPNNIGSVNIGE
jgi:hypothetical protein